MSFSKSFYKQHGKEINQEVKKYDAHAESKEVKFKKCDHKGSKIINGELRCKCGAAWRGPRIYDLYKELNV